MDRDRVSTGMAVVDRVGEKVGVVVSVDPKPYVEFDANAVEELVARLGLGDGDGEATYPLHGEMVAEVTDDEVILTGRSEERTETADGAEEGDAAGADDGDGDDGLL
jgi:hypothetical protein